MKKKEIFNENEKKLLITLLFVSNWNSVLNLIRYEYAVYQRTTPLEYQKKIDFAIHFTKRHTPINYGTQLNILKKSLFEGYKGVLSDYIYCANNLFENNDGQYLLKNGISLFLLHSVLKILDNEKMSCKIYTIY